MGDRVGIPPHLRRRTSGEMDRDVAHAASAILRAAPLEVWSSDHREEAKHLSAHNYIGITPICRMAARAQVKVYHDGGYKDSDRMQAVRRKRLWLRDNEPIFSRKAYSETDVGELLDATHEAYRLLYQPNKRQSGGATRWQHVQQLHTHGISLMFNCPNVQGTKIAERFVIPISCTQPLMPGQYEQCPNGGVRVYARERMAARLGSFWQLLGAVGAIGGLVIPAEYLSVYMFPHIASMGDGQSPTSAVGAWIDLAEEIDSVRLQHVRRGPQPKILVTPPPEAMQSEAKLLAWQDKYNERIKGNDSTLVAIPAGQVVLAGMDAEEMGYSDAFSQLGPAIMAAHGTPKAAVGMSDSMTYGSIAAVMGGFCSITVQGDLDIIAEEDTRTFAKEYGEGLSIVYEAPTFDDPDLREKQNQTDLQARAVTKNEWRKMRGLPAIEGPRGEEWVGAAATESAPADGGDGLGEPGSQAVIGATGKQPGKVPPKEETTDHPVTGLALESLRSGGSVDGKAEKGRYVVGLDLHGTILPNAGKWTRMIKSLQGAGATVIGIGSDGLAAEELAAHGIHLDGMNSEEPDLYWDASLQVSDAPEAIIPFLRKSFAEAVAEQPKQKYGVLMGRTPQGVHNWHAGIRRDLDSSLVIDVEDKPHVTVLYGLLGISPEEVFSVVSRLSPIEVTAGKLCWFGADEKRGSDVLYAEITSGELLEVRRQLESRLPWLDSHGVYIPHMTIAYLVPGTAEAAAKSLQRAPISWSITQIEYSMPGSGDRLVIPLRG